MSNEPYSSDGAFMQAIQAHTGKILVSVAISFICFTGLWALNIDRQMTQMNGTLSAMSYRLESIVKKSEQREAAARVVESRLQRIENTRVTGTEMADLRQKTDRLKEQVIRLEITVKTLEEKSP